MNHPLVSVHIITYNQNHYIDETIRSVIEQDYENLEIVIADDGSTDGTAKTIQEYSRRYPKKIIPLVGGQNLGITGNSNRGLAACSGKYIAFLGGDDIMFPQKISSQVAFMESHPDVALCYHDLEVFDDESGEVMYLFSAKITPREGGVKTLIKYGCINGGSSTMLRRSCAPDRGFDESLPVASDWLYWIDSLLVSNGKIKFIDKVLGRYRRHNQNVTNHVHGYLSQNVSDHLATGMKIIYKYPEYSKYVLYRLASIIRGLRHKRDYYQCLIGSLRCSVQIKTLAVLFAYLASFCVLKL